MSWLIEAKWQTRFKANRFWSRVHFELTELDGEDAEHAALTALVACFQSGHFVSKLSELINRGSKITHFQTRAVQPTRSATWAALPPALPRFGTRIEDEQLTTPVVRIQFLTRDRSGSRSNLQLHAAGYQTLYRNEYIGTYPSQLEDFATDFVTPRVLPTTQTLVGAVLRSDGTYRQAEFYQTSFKPRVRRSRRLRI